MKKTLLILAAVAFSFGSAIAQEKSLTSNSSLVIEDTSAACGATDGSSTSENHYFKKFNLDDLGVEDTFNAQSFQFGVQNVTDGIGEGVELTVNLYKTTVNSFPATWGGSDYTLAGTTTVTAMLDDNEELITAHFADPIVFAKTDIVIAEVWHADLDSGVKFYIGSNSFPDDQPSYILAEGCDINVPTPTGAIGFPDMNLIFVLKGVEGTLGVQDFVSADLTLYPNPASDQFNISSGNEVIQSVIVRDILGKTIETIEVNGLNQNVNVSNLPKGLYLIEVELETGRAVQKLIKK